MTTTVRKFRVGGKLTPADKARILDELDTQHRNRNKHIQIDRLRRQEVRRVQAEHPHIGELTRRYEELERRLASVRSGIASGFEPQLKIVNAKIAAAGKGERTSLTKERKALEKAQKDTIKQALEPIAAEMKQCSDALRDLKRNVDKAELYAPINKRVKELEKAANQDLTQEEAAALGFRFGKAGHSGTKWWITSNAQQAAKARLSDLSEESDPPFRPYHSAYITSEIQEGTLCAGINQTKSANSKPLSGYNSPDKGLLYIPNPPTAQAYDPQLTRSQRKKLQRRDVFFRLGTIDQKNPETGKLIRKPEWIKLPDVIFHREIPAQAVVLEALLKLERVGTNVHLYLILTVDDPTDTRIVPATPYEVTVQCHTSVGDAEIGYAFIPETGEVLTLSTAPRNKERTTRDSNSGELWRCSVKAVQGRIVRFRNGAPSRDQSDVSNVYTHLEGLQRIQKAWLENPPTRDQWTQRREGQDFIAGSRFTTVVIPYIKTSETLPRCLADVRDHIEKWRSTGKLQRLYRAWRDERCPGDEEAFEAMEEWARKDLHFYQWIRGAQTRMHNRAVDTFRKEALRLCRQYSSIKVDNRDMTESQHGVTEKQASARTKWAKKASFGLFREILIKTAKRTGVAIEKIEIKEMAQAAE